MYRCSQFDPFRFHCQGYCESFLEVNGGEGGGGGGRKTHTSGRRVFRGVHLEEKYESAPYRVSCLAALSSRPPLPESYMTRSDISIKSGWVEPLEHRC